MNSKAVGGVLLILGTSIGAGMLALPLDLAQVGFFKSIGVMLICWFAMYLAARFLLEVNLTFESGSHLVSMAKRLLGWPGQMVAWGACLALLYSLLAGYIAGGSDILRGFVEMVWPEVPRWFCTIGFTVSFGGIVYAGIRVVDYVNRGLMFLKLFVFLLVVGWLAPSIRPGHWQMVSASSWQAIPASLMIVITSFGFASLIPSLRYYFEEDIALLRRVLLWGSVIPLLCYIAWNAVMMGVIPTEGAFGLIAISHLVNPISGLVDSLGHYIHGPWLSGLFHAFAGVCMLTAFLGVALGLFDFLADGLSCGKRGWQGLLLVLVTFMPPMCMVLWSPGIYLMALQYAGRCCVLLLLLLPALMAWKQWPLVHEPLGRYLQKWSIYFTCLCAVALLVIG